MRSLAVLHKGSDDFDPRGFDQSLQFVESMFPAELAMRIGNRDQHRRSALNLDVITDGLCQWNLPCSAGMNFESAMPRRPVFEETFSGGLSVRCFYFANDVRRAGAGMMSRVTMAKSTSPPDPRNILHGTTFDP